MTVLFDMFFLFFEVTICAGTNNSVNICAGTNKSDTQDWKEKMIQVGGAVTAESNGANIYERFIHIAKATGYLPGNQQVSNEFYISTPLYTTSFAGFQDICLTITFKYPLFRLLRIKLYMNN
jgi:hypothetical protein